MRVQRRAGREGEDRVAGGLATGAVLAAAGNDVKADVYYPLGGAAALHAVEV
jgi:hypothetical protein